MNLLFISTCVWKFFHRFSKSTFRRYCMYTIYDRKCYYRLAHILVVHIIVRKCAKPLIYLMCYVDWNGIMLLAPAPFSSPPFSYVIGNYLFSSSIYLYRYRCSDYHQYCSTICSFWVTRVTKVTPHSSMHIDPSFISIICPMEKLTINMTHGEPTNHRFLKKSPTKGS